MDLEVGYLVTVNAEKATAAQREVKQGFADIDKAAVQADASIKKVEATSRTVATQFGTMEARVARGRAELLAFARAGVQAKNDIERLGGVQRLTTAELDRSVATIGRATRAYETLGRQAPAGLERLQLRLGAIRQVNTELAESAGKATGAGNLQAAMLTRVAGAFGAYLSVGAIYGAIRSTTQWADVLQASAIRAGTTVERYQALAYAAKQNNVEITSLTSAMNQFQNRAASGDDSVNGALAKINLRWSELQKLQPDEHLYAISDGLRSVTSHEEKVAILNDLFGRQGSELLPVMASNMRALGDEAKRTGAIMSEDVVNGLASANDAWDNMQLRAKVALGQLTYQVIESGSTIKDWADGAVANIALVIAAAAKGVYGGLGLSLPDSGRRGADTLGGSGATSFWPTAPGSPMAGLMGQGLGPVGFNPLDPKGYAALMAIDSELESSARERLRTLTQQANEAERQRKAFRAIVDDIRAFEGGRGMRGARETEWIGGIPIGNTVDIDAYDSFFGAGSPGGFNALMLAQGLAAVQRARPVSQFVGGVPVGQMVDLDASESFWGTGGAPTAGFGANLMGSLSDMLPQLILQSITGGGNLAQGVTSGIGSAIGASVVKGFSKEFAETALGSTLGAILPGVGALLGPVLSPVFNKLLKTESIQTNATREQFVQSFGGLHELNVKAHEAGMTLDRFLKVDNQKEYEAEVAKLTEAMKQHVEEMNRVNQQLVATTGLIGRELIESVLGQVNDSTGGEQTRAALQQFYTANLGRAQTGFGNFFEAGGQVTAGNASAFGGGLAAIVGERTGAGEDMASVLASLAPTIAAAQAQFVKLGVDGGAAFANIASLAAFAKDEAVAPALQQVSALNDILIGLGNTALLDQGMFKGFEDQVGDTYDALIKQGKNGDQALQLMQPTLQTLWELETDRGFAVDGTTKKMLEQAKKAGIVGEDFRSAEDKMTAAVDRLITRLDVLITQMFPGLEGAAGDAATDIVNKFDGVEITIPINYKYETPEGNYGYPEGPDWNNGDQIDGASRGGYVTPYGVQHLALGGSVQWQPRGSDTVPAMLTPGEFVVDRPTVGLNGGPSGVRQALSGGGGMQVAVTIQGWDGADILRTVKSRDFKLALAQTAQSAEMQATYRAVVRANVKPEARL